jgi:serine/threonine protein kinase
VNAERLVNSVELLNYLMLAESHRPPDVEQDVAVAAAMIENELGPALRQLGESSEQSPYESEAECQSAIFKLAYLPSLPFTAAGTIHFLREYELLDELGSGGMGTVFRARHAKLGKLFAVKVLSPKLPRDDRTVSRFLREMRAAGKIEHPNVVCATDASEVDGIHYLVMEFIDGVNLSQLVKATGPLSSADACDIVRLTALGLQAIHDHGLVHRDIKPSNLMLTSRGSRVEGRELRVEGREHAQQQEDSDSRLPTLDVQPSVKILDLGLALLHDPSATSVSAAGDRVVGTVQYMAPEQFADSHHVDARADLYSLGCTLHYLLSGRPPTPSGDSPAVSAEVASVLDRLLAYDPADRFASAADVVAAIQPLCADADLSRLALRAGRTPAAELDTVASQSETLDFSGHAKRGKTSGPGRVRALVAASILLLVISLLGAWSFTRTSTGELILSVNQSDATVSIDGKPAPSSTRIQAGEVTLRLPPGDHHIRIQASGHETWSESITINSREAERLVVRLVSQASDATIANTASAVDLDTRERRLAEWVLERGGSVRLYPGGDISGATNLPPGKIRIQSIMLSRIGLVDADAIRFLGMSNLQSLELSHNQLTSRAVVQLSQIKSLRWLYLAGNYDIDDGAAEHLARLESLESLDLSNTRITDATVAEIKTLPKLRELRIGYTGVTSECLDAISGLSGLVRLDVSGTSIGDQNLSELRKLPELKYLLLNSTPITDDAVGMLGELSHLAELELQHTDLSAAAIGELRILLNNCQVTY